MDWTVEYTKIFLKELARLPSAVRKRAEKIAFEDLRACNPFQLGYVEQLRGYRDKYKIRVGDYRMGIEIVKEEKLVICRRIAHRKDIYRIFP